MAILPRGMSLGEVPKQTKEKILAGRHRKLVEMDKFLAERISDFRHAQQIDTESATIRRLIVRGLAAERDTPRVTSKAERDADLRARLKANDGGMCTDIVLLQAIADAKDYMVAGVFIPIDPGHAEDRIISGDPCWVMRAESNGDEVEIATRDKMWRVSLERGVSIGAAFYASVMATGQKLGEKVV